MWNMKGAVSTLCRALRRLDRTETLLRECLQNFLQKMLSLFTQKYIKTMLKKTNEQTHIVSCFSFVGGDGGVPHSYHRPCRV